MVKLDQSVGDNLGRMDLMGDALLQTRAHVMGDRDFLFGFLRNLNRLWGDALERPRDEAALTAFHGEMAALRAFVEEKNAQAGARRTRGDGV